MAEFYIKFWGTRGTIPVVSQDVLHYGGNTSCIEVRCNGRQIILDAGTGIYILGLQTEIYHTDILLSHSHLDHIQGLPFFKPLHTGGDANVALWAGHLLPENSIMAAIDSIMSSPLFPLTIKDVRSRVEFNDFRAGTTLVNEGFELAGIKVHTKPLSHPDRATAYRIEFEGKSVCYVTDVEHKIGKIDKELIKFIKGADIFIYDSTFDDDSFAPFVGWGHSTWQEGVRLANAAGVKHFVAFHHDPATKDSELDKRQKKLQKINKNYLFAREGMVMDLMEK
ncbi:MBL fold metallo-hydrolase [Rickettsiales bacterium]|nr:MBL fold metallo-hydrolase [Rickettsiales bacterium]